MRRWDEGRRRNGVCAPLHGKGWRSAPFEGRWVVASSPLLRLRGLAGRRPDSTVMVFPRCRDVHTLTMRHPLDVAFLDRRGRVVAVHRLVLPGARLRCGRAWAVVERFAPAGALVRPRRCVSAPRCSATQKAEGVRSRQEIQSAPETSGGRERLRTKPREGDIDENLPSLREHPVR